MVRIRDGLGTLLAAAGRRKYSVRHTGNCCRTAPECICDAGSRSRLRHVQGTRSTSLVRTPRLRGKDIRQPHPGLSSPRSTSLHRAQESTSPLDQDRRGAPCGLSENVNMRPCGMRLFEDYMFIPAKYEGWIGSGYVSTIVCAASPSEAIQALQADDRERVTASGVKGVQYGCRTGAPTESQRGRPRGTQQSLRQVVVTHRVSLSAQWVRARRRGRTPSLPHSSRTRNNTTELDMQRYL